MHGGAIEFSTVDDLDSDSEFLQAWEASWKEKPKSKSALEEAEENLKL